MTRSPIRRVRRAAWPMRFSNSPRTARFQDWLLTRVRSTLPYWSVLTELVSSRFRLANGTLWTRWMSMKRAAMAMRV